MQKAAAQKLLLVLTKDGRVLVNNLNLPWNKDELWLLKTIVQRFAVANADTYTLAELGKVMMRDGETQEEGEKRYLATRKSISQRLRNVWRDLRPDFEIVGIYIDGSHPPKNVSCSIQK
jgi:hypothetical protein